MKGRKASDAVRELWTLAAVPFAAIVAALLIGAVLIVVSSTLVASRRFDPTLPVRAYLALIQGACGSVDAIAGTLVITTPLLLTGLGVAIGLRAGLLNIGGLGQFLVGAAGAVGVSILVAGQPPVVAIPLALIGGMAGGAMWGLIPGLLKAVSGASEVVTTIMMNYIGAAVVSWLVIGPLRQPGSLPAMTHDVAGAALPMIVGRNGHLGIVIAFAAVPLVWFFLFKTVIGFEIRAVGANPSAALVAGMPSRLLTVLTMSLAGLLSGLAGAITVLGINHTMNPTFSTTVGWDAITVALIGRAHPIGVLLGALFLGGMRAGAGPMQVQAGVPTNLVDFVQAVILLFLIANVVFRRFLKLPDAVDGALGPRSGSYGSERAA